MGLSNISNTVDQLIDYWNSQGISPGNDFNVNILNKSVQSICNFNDFMCLYSRANGMSNKYPYEYDREGFLFYPAENIEVFKINNNDSDNREVLIFGDYLHKCWWYGIKVLNESSYEILLVEGDNLCTFISNSLNDFLIMYMNDLENIYPRTDV